jgi:hypothetical protein
MIKKFGLFALVFIAISAHAKNLKIAIFDYDFTGHVSAAGRSLPSNTVFIPGNVKLEIPSALVTERPHGLTMAEILSAEIGTQINYQLLLYEVRGFKNFQEAISDAIRRGVNLIVHPLVRDYGGNFDGDGFVNAEVNRATSAGITWLNAAGNYGKTSFTGEPAKYDSKNQNWVKMPGYANSLPIKCAPPKEDDVCNVRFTLSWTAHSNDPAVGTDKDLDFELADDTMTNMDSVQRGNRKQVVGQVKNNNESNYPREVIEADLKPGSYTIRVSNMSSNFSDSDRFRIATDSPFIFFEYSPRKDSKSENYDQDENIFNPADNKSVITVGASDFDRSSKSVALGKPEILIPSRITLPGGDKVMGSSVAVVRAAARAAVSMVSSRELSKDGLVALLDQPGYGEVLVAEGGVAEVDSESTSTSTSTSVAESATQSPPVSTSITEPKRDSTPTQADCFVTVQMQPQAHYINMILTQGGVPVQTATGLKIALPFDPMQLIPRLRRVRPDDMVLATPQGLILRPRREEASVPNYVAEVFELPPNKGICN